MKVAGSHPSACFVSGAKDQNLRESYKTDSSKAACLEKEERKKGGREENRREGGRRKGKRKKRKEKDRKKEKRRGKERKNLQNHLGSQSLLLQKREAFPPRPGGASVFIAGASLSKGAT